MKNIIKSAKATLHPNYIRLPVTVVDSVDDFNAIYNYWKSREEKGLITYGIERTKSGGISYNIRLPSYDVTVSNIGCELLCLALDHDKNPCFYRLQYRSYKITDDHDIAITGRTAFKRFSDELLKDGIDITKYFIDNGIDIKREIEKPLIKVADNNFLDKTFEGAHHLDICSSYPYGMAKCYPEWYPTINRLYESRDRYPINKAILNLSCGYMQSVGRFKARLAHVSKYAINLNNKRVRDMAEYLELNGRVVLLYNTDGIWYIGKSINQNNTRLGGWKEDHKNCKIRIKSAGAYEFIENGVYHPVLRGHTRLDDWKVRELWNWGDIYHEDADYVYEYIFDRERGIIDGKTR